ncbi:vacuolar ATPase assembly integral membrane protein VMA21 [Lutzomyia longipalpis]|uniref:Putative vacuolar atpase assembly integral membrane protein vma21 n=1 Tax=Lutzomyia longipalpis TaxID=7200 RepID=A0A1B0CH63_LUTLO|nr:vacuolar ATPase assembly integral membrane protein VMA21 [Lutzomyia longipalpis]
MAFESTGKDSLNVQEEVDEEEPLSPEEERKRNKETSIALLTLFFFSLLMFTLPFGAFYGMRDLLSTRFHIDGFENTCWSVLAAVITVNAIIIGFVYVAFRDTVREIAEDNSKRREEKKKK